MAAIRVSCSGKLPIHGDFIRHEATGPEFDALEHWFEEGITQARESIGDGWASAFETAAPSRFIFCPEGSPRLLLGVWVPSTDKKGRRFSFAISLSLEKADFERDVSLLPGLFAKFLDSAEGLASKGWTGLDVAGLKARVAKLEPTVDLDAFRSRYDDFVRREKASVFWTGLFGSSDDAGKYLVIQKLHDLSRRIGRADMSEEGLGLRCPLPSAFGRKGTGYEVTYCIDLGMQLFGGHGTPSLAYWDRRGDSDSSRLCTYFGKPSPQWMIPVFSPDRPSNVLLDLGRGDFAQAEMLRRRYESTVGRSELTLAGLLLEVAVLRSSHRSA